MRENIIVTPMIYCSTVYAWNNNMSFYIDRLSVDIISNPNSMYGL